MNHWQMYTSELGYKIKYDCFWEGQMHNTIQKHAEVVRTTREHFNITA